MAVKFTDNSRQVLDAAEAAVERALVAIGIQATGYAVKYITNQNAVDTGLLRNSVTYALDGQAPAQGSYTADRGDGSGTYSGTMPTERGQRAVYIGTNVEYAPYVEYGTSRMRAQPYIQPAVSDHIEEYRGIMASELGKV